MARPSCFVVSVMHTGTTFLEVLLRPSLGFHHVHAHWDDKILPGVAAADVVVAPLRDPRAVWRSFCMRGQPLPYFWDGWENLARLDREHDILYVPVDLPGVRDDCLRAVAAALGRPIRTDWAAAGQFQGDRRTAPPPEPVDLAPVYALPPVRRFYTAPVAPVAELHPALQGET